MKTLIKHTPKRATIPVLKNIMVFGGRATISDCDFFLSMPSDKADGVYSPIGFDTMPALAQGLEIADAPRLPELSEATYSHEYKTAELLTLLELAAQAISKDACRYYLEGCYFTDGHIVATNGHIMHKLDISHQMPDGVIVPDFAIKILIDAMKETKAREVQFSYYKGEDTTYCRFVVGDYELVAKAVDGTYPDYERVIPNSKEAPIVNWNLPDIKKQVDILRKQAGDSVAGVKFSDNSVFYGDKLITACDWLPFDAGFNYAYISQVKQGRLSMVDAQRPAKIEHSLGVTVVMPMRL